MASVRLLQVLLAMFALSTLMPASALEYRIDEEVTPGTVVGNVAIDADLQGQYGPDVAQTLEYSFLAAQEALTIDKSGGTIRTASRVDRETLCPPPIERCELNIDVAVTPAEYFRILNVVVVIDDVNDNAPTFPDEQVSRGVSEQAAPGARISLPTARDPDWGINSVQEYRLVSPTDKFQMEVTTLPNGLKRVNLVLMSELDRESVDSYSMKLVAYDGGDPRLSGELTVNVQVDDANDHSPYFERNATSTATIPENSPVNSSVLRVSATDADIGDNGRIIYSLNSAADAAADQTFGIDPQTGTIYLKQSPDYESRASYTLLVEARDGGQGSQTAQLTVTVLIEDLNDNEPQIIVNALTTSGTAEISESSGRGTFVAHISVTDADSGDNGTPKCRLDDSTMFALETLQPLQYKIITTGVPFDRETQPEHYLQVTCEDAGDPAQLSVSTVIVRVRDENDNAPIFGRSVYSVRKVENNQVGAHVLKVNATDADIGPNADLTYNLEDVTGGQPVVIDPKTGIIRANIVFDFETRKEFHFRVVATDGGTPRRSATASVFLTILDTNDNAPVFSRPAYTFEVLENQPVGMEIGLVAASDADSDPYNRVEFSFRSTREAQLFAVDAQTGHVRTRASLDREYKPQYELTLVATNVNVDHALSSTTKVTIVVRDQNDNAPHVDFPNQSNHTLHLSNRVPVGYHVGLVSAHDVDEGDNARLTFSFTRGSDRAAFRIDDVTGLVTTTSSLEDHDNKLFEMQILVSDHGVPPKTATATLYIVVDRSIVFTGTGNGGAQTGSLLGGTNLTIVIGLAISSAIIVVILLVAIILTRVNSRKRAARRRPPPEDKYFVAATPNFPSSAAVKSAGGPPTKNSNLDNNNKNNRGLKEGGRGAPSSSGGSGGKKEVSFNVNNEAVTSCARSQGQKEAQGKIAKVADVNKKNNCGDSGPQVPAKTSHVAPALSVAQPGSTYSGALQDPAAHAQKLWELNVKQLQCQQWFDSLRPDQDADNSSSGEASTTDSGRGPSEEGDPSLASIQAPVIGAPSKRPAPQPSRPPPANPGCAGRGRQGRQQSQQHAQHKCQHQGQHQGQYQGQSRGYSHGDTRLPSAPHHGATIPTYGVTWSSDVNSDAYGNDNASTTSGSYVVDHKDLDDMIADAALGAGPPAGAPSFTSVVV